MATYSVMLGTSPGELTSIGVISCPTAAPKGLASDATAVADTRPTGENHKSE